MGTPVPPAAVRGIKILNKQLFNTLATLPSLKIDEFKLAQVMKSLKKYLIKMDNFKPIQCPHTEKSSDGPLDFKYAYLDPALVVSWTDIKPEDRDNLINAGITESFFQKTDTELKYDNWKTDEILKAILPTDNDSLTSYSNIGHIVHVNLKDHLLEYKGIIGEVLLDKIKGCKTVVNKTNTIDNTYRNFQMEVLSGEEDFQTVVKENNCSFEFDFSKVYWNPRLSTEHLRIINMLKKDDVLFDVFAGVGPFAIPCAKKKCTVYANDLNPESYKWLLHNGKQNKVKGKLEVFNLDGKEFICNIVSKYLWQLYMSEEFVEEQDIYFTMNLPAMAVEFLQYFKGLLKEYDASKLINFKRPIVHVYCFVPGNNSLEEAEKLVQDNLHCSLGDMLIDVFNVRNVSPNKEMMRVTFYLTKDLLFDINCGSNKRKRSDIE